jgi:hypothetical protein
MLLASALIRTAQSPRSYLSGTERAKAQTNARPRRYIEAGLKLAALSLPVAAARLGASLYLPAGPYVIPRIDQRDKLEAS